MNSIDPDNGLIIRLLSKGVISQRQSEFILSCPPCSEKVEAFLEILLRRSSRDLNATVKCLLEDNQPHIANLLYKDGGKFSLSVLLCVFSLSIDLPSACYLLEWVVVVMMML